MGPPVYFIILYGHERNTTEREGEKEQTNNMDWCQLQTQEREFVWGFCADFRAFVDYRGRVFGAKLLQSYKKCQLIFNCLPSLPPSADRPSLGLLSHANWSLLLSVVDCLPPSFFINWLLSFLGTSFPPPLPVSPEISTLSPLFEFRAKTDKEIICLAHHQHSVTMAYQLL